MGCQQSRRDDLEAVAYMLLYLQRGGLPWDGVPEKDLRKKNTEIQKRKQMTPVPQLIGNDVPPVFAVFLEYSKSLKYKEDPDYDKMRGLFTGFAKQAKLTQSPARRENGLECSPCPQRLLSRTRIPFSPPPLSPLSHVSFSFTCDMSQSSHLWFLTNFIDCKHGAFQCHCFPSNKWNRRFAG